MTGTTGIAGQICHESWDGCSIAITAMKLMSYVKARGLSWLRARPGKNVSNFLMDYGCAGEQQ